MKGDAEPEGMLSVDGLRLGVDPGLGVVRKGRRSDIEMSPSETAISFWPFESESFVIWERASWHSKGVSEDRGLWLPADTGCSLFETFLPK